MGMLETILNANNGSAVDELSRQFGLDRSQTQSALDQLVPALNAGMKRNIQNQPGLDSLLGALAGGRHEQYLDAPDVLDQRAAVADGNGILGHIFGSKEVSREVAGRAAQKTGLDANTLKRMLPLVAAMLMGAMSKRTSSMGVQRGAPQSSAGGMLGSLLDADGDGSIVDDLWGMAKRFFN